MTVFIDTNILLYSISKDPLDSAKRATAIALLADEKCALSLQVLNEFMWQATRPSSRYGVPLDDAVGFVGTWRRFPVLPLDLALFDAAHEIKRRTKYTWWDSLIVAAAIALGCDTLATEDLQHGRIIDGVRIVNPFRDVG